MVQLQFSLNLCSENDVLKACFICFSQKFFCTAGHIDFCNETSEQKFLYRSVQKISVKSRWNKLMSLKYDFQNLIFKIINLLSVRYFPHLNIAKWRNICVWIFMGFPLESMNWSCWTLTFLSIFSQSLNNYIPQVCTYIFGLQISLQTSIRMPKDLCGRL